jgi:hypothetical protein
MKFPKIAKKETPSTSVDQFSAKTLEEGANYKPHQVVSER